MKILAILLACLLSLTACSKEGSTEKPKDIPDEKAETTLIEKKNSSDVSISVLERVYESKAGIQLTSRYQFASMLNNNTTFQLEYAEPDDSVVVRVDGTDYYQVDFDKLCADEKLFTDLIAPKNIVRNGAQFSVEGNVAKLTYKSGDPPNLKYCTSAVVFSSEEVFKVYTESTVDYYTDVLSTIKRVKPQSNESYQLVVQEIDKLSFKDIAINVPFKAHDAWETYEEGRRVKVSKDSDTYIELYYNESLTAETLPKPQEVIDSLEWPDATFAEQTDEKTGIYFMSVDAVPNSQYGLTAIPYDTGYYMASATGGDLRNYLKTLRLRDAPDIYSNQDVSYESIDNSTISIIEETLVLNDMQFTVPKGVQASKDDISYSITFAEDDNFQTWPAMRAMTTSTIKKDSLDIKTVQVEGDHFVAVATDGATYYYKQFNVDGKLWNIRAIGKTGFSIAKSAKVAEQYKTFKDRGWQRTQFGKATFMVPAAFTTDVVGTTATYYFPEGGKLIIEEVKKLPTVKEYPLLHCSDESLFFSGDSTFIAAKLDKQCKVTATNLEAMEVLLTFKVGK